MVVVLISLKLLLTLVEPTLSSSHVLGEATGNSHQPSTAALAEKLPPPSENHKPSGEPPEHQKKEKSVLQAKLTKLAIQIGYGGK